MKLVQREMSWIYKVITMIPNTLRTGCNPCPFISIQCMVVIVNQ